MSSSEKASINNLEPQYLQTNDGMTLVETPSKAGTINSDRDAFKVEDVKTERKDSPTNDGTPTPEDAPAAPAEPDGVLTGLRLFLVFIALMLAVFMFALDQSIVSTAIPVIVSDFNAFSAVAWIVTAYFLTQCGFILLVGQLLTVIKAKYILLGAIFFFELGSLLCALANGMTMLIVSRAIQGIGASGMFVSIMAVIAVVTKVEQRAAFMAAFGFVFVIASVIGPLLGGVFTEQLTWRWCFWINLPVGGVTAAAVVFLLPARKPDRTGDRDLPNTWGETLRRMDWVGSALVIVFITCLLLALQWGGNDYRFDSWRIILLFTLGGVLCIAFFAWEYYWDQDALIPFSILSNRTIIAAAGAIFMLMMAMLGGTYQLPLFYQAGRGHSPQKSGIDIIPFMIIVCVGIFVSGGIVTKFGRYYPFLIIGPPIAAVGFGLLYTIKESSSNARVIGYQLLAGFGVGLVFQNVILAVQAEYSPRPHLIPQATSVVSFFQLTGAALGVGIINVVQSVYLNRLIPKYAPDAPFKLVRESTQAIYQIPEPLRPGVIKAYVEAIAHSYIPIFIALALSIVFGAFIRNHNMLKVGGAAGMHMA